MYSDLDLYKITEQLFYDVFYVHIYYKKMNIKWVLEKFSVKEINKLAEIILKSTKYVEFNNITKTFLCKNKWGWRTIERILMQHYCSQRKNHSLPNNLIELSLYNLSSYKDSW